MACNKTESDFFECWLKLALSEAAKEERFQISDDGKTIQVVERDGKAEVFYTRAPILRPMAGREKTKSIPMDVNLVELLVAQLFKRAYKPAGKHLNFIQLEILRSDTFSCGFHVCINRLSPTYRIITITATLTEQEASDVNRIINDETPTYSELLEKGNALLNEQ